MVAAVVRSRAPATLRAYRSRLEGLRPLCGQLGVDALPAAPAVVAGYVAELADPLSRTAARPGCRPSPAGWPPSARATRCPATPTRTAGGLVGAGYEVVVDAELVAGDGSAPSFYGVAPALARRGHAEPAGLAVFDLLVRVPRARRPSRPAPP